MAVVQFEQFPDSVRSAELEFRLRAFTDYGPTQRDGRQQRVQSSAGFWVAETSYDVAVLSEIREFSAISAKGAGGVTEFFVPTRFRRQAPWPDGVSEESPVGAVTWAGGRTWAASRTFQRQNIDIKVYSAASAGATRVTVKKYKAGTLRRGQYFSVFDSTGRKRLHIVTEVPTYAGVSNVWVLDFSPPLRGPLAANTIMDWENPTCTMVFADPDTGGLRLQSYWQGRPTISWRESFYGL